jgi:hypothetical protein
VVHASNPSYSGGRHQEDRLKSAQANSLNNAILKNPPPKRAGGVAQGVGAKFKPSTTKRIKQKYDYNKW